MRRQWPAKRPRTRLGVTPQKVVEVEEEKEAAEAEEEKK